MYSGLQKQVRYLNRVIANQRGEEVNSISAFQVTDLRQFIWNEFLGFLRRSPNVFTGDTNCDFGALLRRHQLQFSIPCSMTLLAKLRAYADAEFIDDDAKMFPDRVTALNPTSANERYDVILRQVNIFLKWLRVTPASEVNAVNFQIYERKENKGYSRLLGGAQWSKDDDSVPLHLFPGSSCCRDLQSIQYIEVTKEESITVPTRIYIIPYMGWRKWDVSVYF